jgi:hypothetical protein
LALPSGKLEREEMRNTRAGRRNVGETETGEREMRGGPSMRAGGSDVRGRPRRRPMARRALVLERRKTTGKTMVWWSTER